MSEREGVAFVESEVLRVPQGPPLILVVDDSATARAQVRRALKMPPLGARVVEAEDGTAALRQALEEPFDCVLCDLSMPRMDGMTFLRALRAQRTRVELPVLLLTVTDSLAEKVEGFDALFCRADDALYRAKANGRDRVERG